MPTNSKKPAPKNHRRILSLPPALDAALVKAANEDGRPVRVYATRLLAKALGVVLACLLAACSGAPTSPVERSGGSAPVCAGDAAGCTSCGASGEVCCVTQDASPTGFCADPTLACNSHGLGLTSASTCEACGGQGEPCCTQTAPCANGAQCGPELTCP